MDIGNEMENFIIFGVSAISHPLAFLHYLFSKVDITINHLRLAGKRVVDITDVLIICNSKTLQRGCQVAGVFFEIMELFRQGCRGIKDDIQQRQRRAGIVDDLIGKPNILRTGEFFVFIVGGRLPTEEEDKSVGGRERTQRGIVEGVNFFDCGVRNSDFSQELIEYSLK